MPNEIDVRLERVTKHVRRRRRGGRPFAGHRGGRVLLDARSVGMRQDHHAPHDRRLRGPDVRHGVPRRAGRDRPAAVQARRQHGVPVLRAVPAPRREGERRVRPAPQEGRQERDRDQGQGGDDARRPDRVREPQASADVRGPAAARGARPRAGEPSQGAAPRRAAGRLGHEAPQTDAAGAQAHPAGGRHHVHLRDARPGRGHDDVEPPRGHAPGQDRAARRSRDRLREPGHRVRGRVPRGIQHAGGRAEGGLERRRDGGPHGRRHRSPADESCSVRPGRHGEGGRPAREAHDLARRRRCRRARAEPASRGGSR